MLYHTHHLPNGLTFITLPQKGTKTVTILVAVHAGSLYETRAMNGISHFLEHMMFKGTKKRPTTAHIAETLDAIGGEYNAFTGKEWTGYYVKADGEHSDLILDVISDMYLHSLFDEEEMKREKRVILEEMNMYQDTPTRFIEDLIEEVLYGNQPQGWKIIGEPATVRSISRQLLKTYHQRRYTAKNTTVIVSGAVPAAMTKSHITKFFPSFPKGTRSTRKIEVVEKQEKAAVRLHYKKTDQTHMALAFRGYRAGHPQLPALRLLGILLGGNMSSRLFINIREREGLCYYIRAEVQTHSQCAYLSITAGVDNKRVKRALTLTIKELKKIRDHGVSAAELKKAKEYVQGKLALSLETSDEFAFWVAEQHMIVGTIKTPNQVLAEVRAVTLDDISLVAHEVIQTEKLNFALIGPYKDKRIFEEILAV